MIALTVNGMRHQVNVPPDTPLLWVIREVIGLTGTKFGCGMSLCGACTVLVEGKAIRSCVTSVSAVVGKEVTTIEGIPESHPVKQAWIADDVPQCGWCQPGQIVAATALLAANPKPDDTAIDAAMEGILCRCGTYQRIRRAIHRAAGTPTKGGAP